MAEFTQNSTRWNSNDEIAILLESARIHPEWLQSTPLRYPQSGTLILYHRRDASYYKQDGYIWKKRKDGKLARQDHMKLKVKGADWIHANYVHSALVPTFHRRAYWLLKNPEIVLVHYLNVVNEQGDRQSLRSRIIANCFAIIRDLDTNELQLQLLPILSENWPSYEIDNLIAMIDQHRSDTALPFLLQFRTDTATKITLTTHEMPESNRETICKFARSSSCSSASRKGLSSSVTMCRQPSAFSDSVAPIDNSLNTFVQSNRKYSTSESDALPNLNAVTEISDFSPEWSFVQGGIKILIIGPWYLQGHQYSTIFDGIAVNAALIQAGVLRSFTPAHSIGCVDLSIACDGQIISKSVPFRFCSDGSADSNLVRASLIDGLMKKLEFYQRNSIDSAQHCQKQTEIFPPLTNFEDSLLCVSERIRNRHTVDSIGKVNGNSSTTLLHFAAALGFDRLLKKFLSWSREQSCCFSSELDPSVQSASELNRSCLHVAALNNRCECIRVLADFEPQLLQLTDASGKTAIELAIEAGKKKAALLLQEIQWRRSRDHVDSTALWVLTNGETVTDEQRLELINVPSTSGTNLINIPSTLGTAVLTQQQTQSFDMDESRPLSCSISPFAPPDAAGSCSSSFSELDLDSTSWLKEPLSVDIPMDVQVPDSPKTARMWEAVTSPGIVASEGARAQMAFLAQQIIDALPERIKHKVFSSHLPLTDESESAAGSSGLCGSSNPFLSIAMSAISSSEWEDINTLMSPLRNDEFRYSESGNDPLDIFSPPLTASSSFGSHNTPPSIGETSQIRELGDFFNADENRAASPLLQRHFKDLRLSDREQRELYEAAKIIQNAYRQYKARLTNQKQLDAERSAAVVIQSYYRRYKQFCYFKKLHKAAILIQKHFRLNRSNRIVDGKNCIGNISNNCIRLEVPLNQGWRQHFAAVRIQHAFRGHYMRKRQAAARKIQRFMRESKQKLRKVQRPNEDECNVPLFLSGKKKSQQEQLIANYRIHRVIAASNSNNTGCPPANSIRIL